MIMLSKHVVHRSVLNIAKWYTVHRDQDKANINNMQFTEIEMVQGHAN